MIISGGKKFYRYENAERRRHKTPRVWSSEFLGEGPSGHALRKSGEKSPYVDEFLGAR